MNKISNYSYTVDSFKQHSKYTCWKASWHEPINLRNWLMTSKIFVICFLSLFDLFACFCFLFCFVLLLFLIRKKNYTRLLSLFPNYNIKFIISIIWPSEVCVTNYPRECRESDMDLQTCLGLIKPSFFLCCDNIETLTYLLHVYIYYNPSS